MGRQRQVTKPLYQEENITAAAEESERQLQVSAFVRASEVETKENSGQRADMHLTNW